MNPSPKAAWLQKMTLTMGRPRWQSRFFVLLDSEVRYYKDEHAAVPRYIWSLRNIQHVRQLPRMGHRFCLSLEPSLSSTTSTSSLLAPPTASWQKSNTKKQKPLILGFTSEFEMNSWLECIQHRLTRLESSSLIVPTSSTSTSSISSSSSSSSSMSSSLSRRRGVILSALDIKEYPILPTMISPSISSTSSILSSSSSISTIPSSTWPIATTLSQKSNYRDALKHPVIIQSRHDDDNASCSSSSPTFLQYKNQFHLAIAC